MNNGKTGLFTESFVAAITFAPAHAGLKKNMAEKEFFQV
jgi:hypothetical protein